MKKILFAISLLAVTGTLLSSCVKKDFDAPPNLTGFDPKLEVTTTLAELNTKYANKEITDDITIYGIVIGDDRSGNLYKQIAIQDSTGGIALLIDANSLYNDYPVGRKVYIKCKGLFMGNYNDLPQLGYTPDYTGAITGIPTTLMNNYIVKANYPNEITPVTLTLEEAAGNRVELYNRLIKIENVEFDSLNTFKKFADPAPSSGTSRTISGCGTTSTIIMRTSGYSNFQPYLTPSGNGSITAIYTVFKGTPQLVIRDTNDIKMYNPRCNGQTINPPTAGELFSIETIRSKWAGGDVKLPNGRIKGVVISDRVGNNTTTNKSVTIQDGDRGIVVFFNQGHYFAVGDSIVIDITGSTLTDFNGILEIKDLPSSNAEKAGSGYVAPKNVTIKDLSNNFENHESTLVKISNATITGSGNFLGSKTLSDASEQTIVVYTYNSATFANNPVPTTAKNFTAVASQYNSTKQLLLRNSSDIQ